MADLYRKMVDEAMAAQRADVGMVKKKRGQAFVIDAAPARICKDCASAALMDFRHCSCQWKEAV